MASVINCCRCARRYVLNKRQCLLSWIFFVLLLGGIILAIVLPSMYTNKRVNDDEYGVFINKFTMSVRGPYEPNTYNLAIGDSITRFVRTYVPINGLQRIQCLSSDKVTITLSISAQYSYNPHDIIPIVLFNFGNDDRYKQFLSSLAVQSIRQTCSNFTAEHFYLNRNGVENTMEANLANEMDGFASTLISLQLTDFDYPWMFNNVIDRKQLTLQNVTTQRNAREGAILDAETKFLITQDQARIMEMYAINNRSILLTQARDNATVVSTQWQKLGLSYLEVKQALGLDEYGFLAYLRSEILRTTSSSLIALN